MAALRFGKVVGMAAIIDTREERITVAGASWSSVRVVRPFAHSEYASRGRVSRILGLGSSARCAVRVARYAGRLARNQSRRSISMRDDTRFAPFERSFTRTTRWVRSGTVR